MTYECLWCNKPCSDGEWLASRCAFICQPCIDDMEAYKDEVPWQFFVAAEARDAVGEPDQFEEDLTEAVRDVFIEHGLSPDSLSDDWEIRG